MTANQKKDKPLFLEENVKLIKTLPSDMIRLCNAYEVLNEKFETSFKSSVNSTQEFFKCAETKSNANDIKNVLKSNNKLAEKNLEKKEWEEQCLSHLGDVRKYEHECMMFSDEKIALLDENIANLQNYINKIQKDSNLFEQLLQPNMIKLSYPNSASK